MISLKQLHYALSVEKTRHFKRAAELCSVSQSALSTAIAELETQLGIQVFERDNKQVLLTAQGEQVITKARQIKIQVDELYLLAQADKGLFSHPMSIGVIPTICPYLLPKVLPALRQAYPDFKLVIHEETSQELVEKVRTGVIDTAILALPYPVEGLLSFEFWEEDFYLMTHKDDPLAKLSELSSKDLKVEQLMLLKDGYCLKHHALAVCKLQDSQITQTLSGTSLATLIQMVAGKMGHTLVPEIALDQLIQGDHALKAVHLNEPSPHRRLAFITRLNYLGMKNIEALMALFRAELIKFSTGEDESHERSLI